MKRISQLKYSLALIVLITMGAFCTSLASATPITGEIAIIGTFEIVGPDFENMTGLSFPDGTTDAQVESATGVFTPILGATGDFFTDFDFDPVLSPDPVVGLWTVVDAATTYSFDLEEVSVDAHTALFLVLSGTGVMHVTGFDDAEGDWVWTANSLGQTFSFSSTTIAVPEPSTLLSLATGLLILSGRPGRRR